MFPRELAWFCFLTGEWKDESCSLGSFFHYLAGHGRQHLLNSCHGTGSHQPTPETEDNLKYLAPLWQELLINGSLSTWILFSEWEVTEVFPGGEKISFQSPLHLSRFPKVWAKALLALGIKTIGGTPGGFRGSGLGPLTWMFSLNLPFPQQAQSMNIPLLGLVSLAWLGSTYKFTHHVRAPQMCAVPGSGALCPLISHPEPHGFSGSFGQSSRLMWNTVKSPKF